MDAGLGKRLMFGSKRMEWPRTIGCPSLAAFQPRIGILQAREAAIRLLSPPAAS